MIKTNLYNIIKDYNFEKFFAKKGYTFFTKGAYNLNIIGVRSAGRQVTNSFDDYMVVVYKGPAGGWLRQIYQITTDPGLYYMLNPAAHKGTAILVPGQYKGAFVFGKHKGKYKALVQDKPLKVYRDSNKDEIYDWDVESVEEGHFGINIHKAGIASKRIDMWSAGCQVFANSPEYTSFIGLCDKQAKEGHGSRFTYTLVTEEELL